ncbi:hypothetical protein SRABI27_03752 [Pedobacter sp. Bi27]|nr:hypothetical protein SRABI27_03752 [Pedobacter sp. Bi27]
MIEHFGAVYTALETRIGRVIGKRKPLVFSGLDLNYVF